MSILTIENVSFSYAGNDQKVIENITLSIEPSSFVLVMGKSGSGKTTLMKLLKKEITPEGRLTGNIFYKGILISELDPKEAVAKIGYVQQDPDHQIVTDKVWHEVAFGLENLGYDNDTIRKRTAEMAEYFGISEWFQKDVNELSGGQKQLLNLAAVMVMQPEILILDEPTAQLDPIAAKHFIDTVIRLNRELGTTIIMTEHRVENVYADCDQVVVLEAGQIMCDADPYTAAHLITEKNAGLYRGLPAPMQVYSMTAGTGFSESKLSKVKLLEADQSELKQSERVPVTVRDGRLYIEQKVMKTQKNRSEELIRQINSKIEKIGHESQGESTEKKNIKKAVEIKDLTFRYNRYSENVIEDLSLSVEKNSFTAVLGGNGAGKSTLLKLIAGVKKPLKGKVRCDGRVILLPQNPCAVFTEISVEEELAECLMDKNNTRMYGLSREEKIAKVEESLRFMDLLKVRKNNPYDLSGGQQQKLSIAKMLLLEPDILLLDEPTKGLDPEFKHALGEKLCELVHGTGYGRPVTLIMVSHDIEFCAAFTDRCIMMFDGGITAQDRAKAFFRGNRFYTTQANLMAATTFDQCVTCEEVAEAIRIYQAEWRRYE